MKVSSIFRDIWAIKAIFSILYEAGSCDRTQACNLLLAYDDTVDSAFSHSESDIKTAIKKYVHLLNEVYEKSVLSDAPNERIYFRIGKVMHIKGFANDCKNPGIVLGEFTRWVDTSDYCLAHLFTIRDFGCIAGLAFVGTLCSSYANTGFTKLNSGNENSTTRILAHEIAHNFGSLHDGENTTEYIRCSKANNNYGIMGGGGLSDGFSTCSEAAMITKLQGIHAQGDSKCFVDKPKTEEVVPNVEKKTWENIDFLCDPPDASEWKDKCGDNPDPPEPPPEPPKEPMCGNKVVEPSRGEECDCGMTYDECDDPCCYPANVSDEDLQLNSSAQGCRLHTSATLCKEPHYSTIMWAVIIPFIAFLILLLLIALILWLDWRYGIRLCYGHILKRGDHIHVEDEDERIRRLQRGHIVG